jgi:hypothetical protein
MIESLGGKLEGFYFAFGDVDVYAVIDLPDNVAAAAVALAINQTGVVAGKTVVLIPPGRYGQGSQEGRGLSAAGTLTRGAAFAERSKLDPRLHSGLGEPIRAVVCVVVGRPRHGASGA